MELKPSTTNQKWIEGRRLVAATIKITEKIEMWWNAGEGFSLVNVVGDDGAGIGIYVNGMKPVETEQADDKPLKGETDPAFKKWSKYQDLVRVGFKWNTLALSGTPLGDDPRRNGAGCFHHLEVAVVETGLAP